jgi:MoaA/NifB/PqqE/SkfB family radical SAM enzyme
MEVQSLSICVPGKCPNKCKFCVSRMHDSPYEDLITKDTTTIASLNYLRRLAFARDNHCNCAILTGEGEAALNQKFLEKFAYINGTLTSPFRWIELQTSGIGLNEDRLAFLRDTVGVTTISLSVANLFDSTNNWELEGTPESLRFDIEGLCYKIKNSGLMIRLSLNMNSAYNNIDYFSFFKEAKRLGARQITFRCLYISGDEELSQNIWIKEHSYANKLELNQFIERFGTPLEKLPFGAIRYSFEGISTVVDQNSMSTGLAVGPVKYLVLRPNCRLYTRWDDEGSILF